MILHSNAAPTDWARYHKTGDAHYRNRLADSYESLVLRQARRVHSRLPNSVCLDDLIQAGSIGLLKISSFA
jgi:DNA-directed RNA polymerase specialized sigma subunit